VRSYFYLTLFVLTAFPAAKTSAQFKVQGHVYDAETNTPLPGANVFLANTTKGTSSGADGSFVLTGLPAVRLKLVVSFVGYKVQSFEVLPGEPLLFKVMMEPAPDMLNEVVIRARKSSRSEWLSNFALFKQYFIGLSENSRACSFENPRVIKFDKHDGILTAISDSSVVIENRGLGYKLSFLVEEYKLNLLLINIRYHGQVVFEPMTPADEKEKISWARNRLKAYYGSQTHFLRSLCNRNLFEEGFYFDLLNEPNGRRSSPPSAYSMVRVRSDAHNNKFIKVETLKNYNLILDSVRSTPAEPILKFHGQLLIEYIHEPEEYNYQVQRYGRAQVRSTRAQHSRLVLLGPDAVIQPFGQLYPEDAAETAGYWSWELVSESLPLDYDPEADKQILGIKGRPGEVSRP
jgi:hypothetical protein